MRLASLALIIGSPVIGSAVVCSAVACSSVASAQSGNRATVPVTQQSPANCPVGFTARHAPESVLSQVGSVPPPGAQGFRISLRPTAYSTITAADVVLYGLIGPQVLPAAGVRRPTPLAGSEERSLHPHREGDLFQSTVYTRRLTGLQWVDLRSVRYADGTTWTAPTPGSCRVAPDGFLRVGS